MVVKRRKKHGRVYLEEYKSVRIDGKVKSIYIRSLGPEKPVSKVPRAKPRVLDRLEHGPSHRAGDVSLLWAIANQLDFVEIIDGICCGETKVEGISPGKLLTAWAINRVLDPLSTTRLENWIPSTYLPRLMGLSPADFTKDAFLTALDFICYKDPVNGRIRDFTTQIDDAFYRRWRKDHPLQPGEKETVAYDLTSVLFFGVTCPLAELGYNSKKVKRLQVNLALVVSRRDKYPLTHFVYNGSRNASSTVKNLIVRLKDSSIELGTIIWDRGNVSEEYVGLVESAGWNLICGVPKTSNDVCDIVEKTHVPVNPSTFICKSRLGHIYGVKTRDQLYGRKRAVVVYSNQDSRLKKINTQNEALAEIGKELEALSEKGRAWSEVKLHKEIDTIVGSWEGYVRAKVKRKSNGPRIEWKYRTKEITSAERSYGKHLLLSTDETLSANDVVHAYLEKDFIEKVFRTLKTSEEMEPVRHRREWRVRAYLFVCVLAYRLLAVLQYYLLEKFNENETWERADSLLEQLGRVERVQVKLGHQVKTWYLNLSKKNKEILRKIGFPKLFNETVEVDFKM